MTKKDYELIAVVIRTLKTDYDKHAKDEFGIDETEYMYRFEGQSDAMYDVANKLAIELAADNPRFDRNKFLTACGIGVTA